jgi:curli biogenesis system outer membrane secretion channel CsgG
MNNSKLKVQSPKSKIISNIFWILFFVLLLFVIGCGATSRVFIHPNTDMGYIKRVAVIPFENLTNEKYAGEKVSQVFLSEMLIAKDFDIVEPGEVTKALQSVQATGNSSGLFGPEGASNLDLVKLQKITSQLNCQALVIGSVTSYEMVRVGQEQYPQISLNVRLVDGKTGTIIWMSSFTKRGGPGVPFIGFGEKYTLSELTQDVCRNIVGEISKKL